MLDPLNSLAFSMYENRGVFALLLGSGVSRASQIPTGWEIVLDLVRRIAALQGVTDQPDWAAWFEQTYGEPPSYSKLLDALTTSPEERRRIVHSYIEATPEDVEAGRRRPTEAHRAVARLVRDGFVRVIVTTNFDRLIETALAAEGVEPTVIKSDDDLQGALPLVHARCLLLKVHGDYLDTRLRNTEGELDAYSEPMMVTLDRIFDEHGVVVCGWSADWDTALRGALTRCPNRRFPFYWAAKGEPTPLAQDLIAHRAAQIIPIADADSFLAALQAGIEVQAALQRPNPRSVELLVASAKRYLTNAAQRYLVDELVLAEHRTLRERLGDPASSVAGGSLDRAQFQARAERYEVATEAMMRIFYTLGRWGTGNELPLASEALRDLGSRPSLSGITALIGLLTYPGVLVFYAYGLGCVRARRWVALRRWLETPVERGGDRDMAQAAEKLFLWDWEGGDDDWWQPEPQRKHHTPLSDRLSNLFARALSEEFVSKTDFERTFDRFEVLTSLHNLSRTADQATIEAALGEKGRWPLIRVPVGRLAWKWQEQAALLEELGSGDLAAELVGAGFARGDQTYLSVALQNIAAVMSRIASRW